MTMRQEGTRSTVDPRLAGEVRRWHTRPMVHDQTVASHSWNVARLVLAIHPSASRDLLVEAIMHDVGEGGSGDTPAYAKEQSPGLREESRRLQDSSRLGMAIAWGVPSQRKLGDFEQWVLKTADLLEGWEHTLQELVIGNQLARGPHLRTAGQLWGRLVPNMDDTPTERREVALAAQTYMARRRAEWSTPDVWETEA